MKIAVGCGKDLGDEGTVLDLTTPIDGIRDVTHVYLGHELENVPLARLPLILAQIWVRCLPGTRVAVVTPDRDKAAEMDRRARDWGINLNETLRGAGRWPNDVHLWDSTPERLTALLASSGVHSARVVSINDDALAPFPVTNRVAWQCAVVARLQEVSHV